MAAPRSLIKKDELKLERFKESFGKKSHEVYIFYDQETDELVLKLSDPNKPSSLWYLDDEDVALIIDPKSCEAIGFQFFGFTKALEKNKDFNTLWERQRLAEEFSRFRKIIYKPKAKEHETKEKIIDEKAAVEINELFITCKPTIDRIPVLA